MKSQGHLHQHYPNFQDTHTHPTKGNHSFLYYVDPQALTALLVLFRGCGEESQPSSFVCVVPQTHQVCQAYQALIHHSNAVQGQNHCVHATTSYQSFNRGYTTPWIVFGPIVAKTIPQQPTAAQITREDAANQNVGTPSNLQPIPP